MACGAFLVQRLRFALDVLQLRFFDREADAVAIGAVAGFHVIMGKATAELVDGDAV
jgi:hypothetical protein